MQILRILWHPQKGGAASSQASSAGACFQQEPLREPCQPKFCLQTFPCRSQSAFPRQLGLNRRQSKPLSVWMPFSRLGQQRRFVSKWNNLDCGRGCCRRRLWSGVAQVCYSVWCSCGGGNGFWELTPESWLHPSYLVKLVSVGKVNTDSSVLLLSQLMLQSQWKLVHYV